MHFEPKTLMMRGALILFLVLSSGGLLAWRDYELKKATDIDQLSRISLIRSSLESYYEKHSAYPSMEYARSSISGLSGPSAYPYEALHEDGTLCSASGCPLYAVRFNLLTSAAFEVGVRHLTPQGIQ